MSGGLHRWLGNDQNIQAAANGLSNFSKQHSLFGDRVVPGSRVPFSSAGLNAGSPWRVFASRFESGHGTASCSDTGGTFQVASDQAVPPVDALTIPPGVRDGGITWYDGGGDFIIVGRHFVLTGDHVGNLPEFRPPIVWCRGEEPTLLKAVLKALSDS
jgi:hypothetical protein